MPQDIENQRDTFEKLGFSVIISTDAEYEELDEQFR
jgi:hypothetical protein